jgi:Ca-activated chloride channel family protein
MKKNLLFCLVLLLISLRLGVWTMLHRYYKQHKAMQAYATGSPEQASDFFSEQLIADPTNEELNFNAGVVQYRQKKYEQARDSFVRATKSPKSAVQEQAHFNLGNTHVALEQLEEAIKDYEKVLTLNPKNERARHNLELVKEMLRKKQEQQKQEQQKKQQDQEQQEQQQKQEKQDKSQSQQEKNKSQENKEQSQQDAGQSDKDKDASQKKQQSKKDQQQEKQQKEKNDPSENQNPQEQEKKSQQKEKEEKEKSSETKSEQEQRQDEEKQQQEQGAEKSESDKKNEQEQTSQTGSGDLKKASQEQKVDPVAQQMQAGNELEKKLDKELLAALRAAEKQDEGEYKKMIRTQVQRGMPRHDGQKNW